MNLIRMKVVSVILLLSFLHGWGICKAETTLNIKEIAVKMRESLPNVIVGFENVSNLKENFQWQGKLSTDNLEEMAKAIISQTDYQMILGAGTILICPKEHADLGASLSSRQIAPFRVVQAPSLQSIFKQIKGVDGYVSVSDTINYYNDYKPIDFEVKSVTTLSNVLFDLTNKLGKKGWILADATGKNKGEQSKPFKLAMGELYFQ